MPKPAEIDYIAATVAWIPDRSPTGKAVARLATRPCPGEAQGWATLLADGTRVPYDPNEHGLYATPADARAEARRIWHCN